MWAITRDLKEGRTPSLAQVELLAEGLKSLAEDDEDRFSGKCILREINRVGEAFGFRLFHKIKRQRIPSYL